MSPNPNLAIFAILKDVRILLGLGFGSIVAVFLGGWGALAAVDARVDSQVEPRIQALERAHVDLRDDVKALRRDVRDLYDFQKTGRAQPRLEDGGGE